MPQLQVLWQEDTLQESSRDEEETTVMPSPTVAEIPEKEETENEDAGVEEKTEQQKNGQEFYTVIEQNGETVLVPETVQPTETVSDNKKQPVKEKSKEDAKEEPDQVLSDSEAELPMVPME